MATLMSSISNELLPLFSFNHTSGGVGSCENYGVEKATTLPHLQLQWLHNLQIIFGWVLGCVLPVKFTHRTWID